MYLVDGSKGKGGKIPRQPAGTGKEVVGGNISLEGRNSDYSKLVAVYDHLVTCGYILQTIVVTHPDWDHYGGIRYLLLNRRITCPVLLTNRFQDA